MGHDLMRDVMPNDDIYAFEITLHGRTPDAVAGQPVVAHADAWGAWRVLAVPRDLLSVPMDVTFDGAIGRLERLARMYAEPDGSFVWTSPREGLWWQVDGNISEKDGRVLLADLKGSCPAAEFDQLLEAFGWPQQAMMMQLVRPAVFLDEPTFRRHARARGIAGDGQTLRPH
jgi:hypothetical protein